MAHSGQLDGVAHDELEEQDQGPSNRQEVKMMKGLIHMMKQQLNEIKLPPPSKNEIMFQQEAQEVRKEE
eukprot:395870-Prorocentrum_lima.AAC.1